MKRRLGDTLVEVTLAVGIFSMVAVAVVSVVNGSSSDAQTALETTVTREEIDAQAEALRFVHDSYIAGNGSDDTASKRYAEIWRAITSNASSASASILEYAPSDCRTLYEGTNSPVRQQKAFVLNTHNLRNGNANSVVLSAQNNPNLFKPATTYPRIIYNDSGDDLLAEDTGTTIQRAEGIYIVAVKDSNTTNIVTDKTHSTATSAYYDFYIRTCWYGPGAEHPSTISTVIRLYDPDAVSDVDSGDRVFSFHDEIVYGTAADDSGQSSGIASQIIPASNTQALRSGSSLDSTKWRFTAWCDKRVTRGSVCNGTQYASWTAPPWLSYNRQINMYPIFAEKFARVVFYANDGTSTSKTQDKITIGVKTKLAANTFVYANHTFNGWCTVKMDVGKSCTGTKYSDGAEIKPTKEETFNLYAMWKRNFMTVAYNGNGATDGSMSDQKLYAGADGTLSKNKFTRTGYTFVGWCTTITSGSTCPSGYSYFDNQATITAGTIASWSGKTLRLFAIWKKIPNTVSYTVKYYTHDIGKTYSQNGSSLVKTATAGSSVNVSSLLTTIPGFTYKTASLSGGRNGPGDQISSATISADGKTTINIFYRRNHLYTVLHLNGGTARNDGQLKGCGNDLAGYSDSCFTYILRGAYGTKVTDIDPETYEDAGGNGLVDWNSEKNSEGYYDPNQANRNRYGGYPHCLWVDKPWWWGYGNPVYAHEWKCKYDGKVYTFDQWPTTDGGTDSSDANGFCGAKLSEGDYKVHLYINWEGSDLDSFWFDAATQQKNGTPLGPSRV